MTKTYRHWRSFSTMSVWWKADGISTRASAESLQRLNLHNVCNKFADYNAHCLPSYISIIKHSSFLWSGKAFKNSWTHYTILSHLCIHLSLVCGQRDFDLASIRTYEWIIQFILPIHEWHVFIFCSEYLQMTYINFRLTSLVREHLPL